MGDIHISYKKLKTYTPEEFDYDSSDAWYDETMKRFRALKFRPEGKGDLQDKWWGMSSSHQTKLRNALKHRFDNKGDPSKGWRVFDDIIGEYEIRLDDKTIIQRRMNNLSRILDILNAEKKLTSEDPNPSREHIGETEVSEPKDIDMETAIRKGTLVTAIEMGDKLSMGGVMGYVSRNFPQFVPKMKKVSALVKPQVDEMLQLIEKEGITPVEVMLKEEFPEEGKEKKGGVKKEDKKSVKLEYFFATGDYDPETVYYENEDGTIEGSISLKMIIRKIKAKKKADELNNIKPGGAEWPESSTGQYTLVLSTHPMDVVLKSTTRPWASSSCEVYSGLYKDGPFSDVNWGNCIAYVFTANTVPEGWPDVFDGSLRSRTLLRWGDADNTPGNSKIGIEKRMYPSGPAWSEAAATAIVMILNDAGHFNYKQLRTPYQYQGWGDTQGAGRCELTYRGHGFQFEGRTITVEDSGLAIEMALASSPSISYSDMMRLSRLRTDVRVKRELAQNPSLFMTIDALGRLIRTKDLTITQFLASSPLVPPELLINFAENAPYFEDDYISTDENALPRLITSHINCPLEAHKILRDNHPGYGDLSFDDVHYYGLANTGSFMCPAPHEMMDELVENAEYPLKLKTKAAVASRANYVVYSKIASNLLMAPNMSKYHYRKMVEQILGFMNKSTLKGGSHSGFMRGLGGYREGTFKGGKKTTEVYKAVNDLIVRVGVSFCVPLSLEGWGFNNNIGGIEIGMGGIPEDWKGRYEEVDRQFVEVMNSVMEICPEIAHASELFNGHNIFFETLRNQSCVGWAWDNMDKYGISSESFMQMSRSKTDFLTASDRVVIPNNMLMQSYLITPTEKKSLLKWSFLPNNLEERKIRRAIPRHLLNEVLSEPEAMKAIGVDVVAIWLTDPNRHFELFESIILKIALRDLWSDGIFIDPPENYEEFYSQVEDIGILDIAATGVVGEDTGLLRNPRLPVNLQYSLLREWVDISNKYEGTYGIDMHLIESLLAMNPNISTTILEEFSNKPTLQLKIASNSNAPQNALAGAKARGQRGSLYHKYPVEVLTNPGLTDYGFESLWALTMRYLTTEVDLDIDRLFNLWGPQKSELVKKGKGSHFRHNIIKNLEGNKKWLHYWRGGTNKFQKFESDKIKLKGANIWLQEGGVGGIADYPILIEGKKSVLILYDPKDTTRNKIYLLEKTIPKGEHIIYAKGQVYEWDEEMMAFVENEIDGEFPRDSFYQFIPPEKRAKEQELLICGYCHDTGIKKKRRFKSVNEDEVRQHYRDAHPELQMRGKYRRYFFKEPPDETHPLWNQYQEEGRLAFEFVRGVAPPDKWNYDFVFVFADVDPPKGEIDAPQWRYSWDKDMLDKILKTYVQRSDPQRLILDWSKLSLRSPYPVKVKQVKQDDWAMLTPENILRAIHEEGVWTEELVDLNLKYLFKGQAALFRIFAESDPPIPLTEKMLSVSLNYTKTSWKKYKINSAEDLSWVQRTILSYSDCPIQYIYDIQQVALQEVVLNMANQARLGDPLGYNQYYLERHPAPTQD